MDKPSAEIGRKGVRIVEDLVEEMRFVWREMPQPDLGIDGMIELKIGDSPTAQFIMVQIKTGISYIRNERDDSFDCYSEPNHLVYWRGCPGPVILVVVEPISQRVWWKDIKIYLRQNPHTITTGPHKITFSKLRDRFTLNSADAFRSLFGTIHADAEKLFREHTISKHSKFTLYSITSDRPLSVELEKVFISLSAKNSTNERTVVHEFAKAAEVVGMRNIETTLPINSVLRMHHCLIIVGAPGAGKTTLLKYLALAFARGMAKERLAIDEERIPIFVALRDFNVHLNNSINRKELDALGPSLLPNFLHKHYADTCARLNLSDRFFASLLDSGRCVLLLDGLDEVADFSDRARMARLIALIVGTSSWKDNRCIITSRPRGFEGEPQACLSSHCVVFAILPFTETEVEQFTLAWYQAVTFERLGDTPEARHEAATRASSLAHAIRTEPRVSTLATNPLLLSVLAMVHERNVELPRQRAKLYEECTTFLLGYWDESKDRESVSGLGRLGGLTREQKRSLLEPVALRLHERGSDNTEVEFAELEQQFSDHFIDQGKPRAEAKARAVDMLHVIIERSGLLVEVRPGVFAFAHLSFQEYLAARAVLDRTNYIEFTLAILHDPWWREVILLEAGLLADTRSGERTARRRTRPFLEAVRSAGSWKENLLHRDLLLSIRCLGDMEDMGVDRSLHERLSDEAISLWKHAMWARQRIELVAAFAHSANTPQGQRFIEFLQNEAHLPDSLPPKLVIEALGTLGNPAAVLAVGRRLLEWSRCGNVRIRRDAVLLIGGLGKTASKYVVNALLDLIQDNDSLVRFYAAGALRKCVGVGEEARCLGQLLALTHNADSKIRQAAVNGLWKLGRRAATAEVLVRLLELTHDLDGQVRFFVVGALGDLCHGEFKSRAIEWLLKLIGHRSDDMRLVAGYALAKLADQPFDALIINSLVRSTLSARLGMRDAAVQALGFLGRRASTDAVFNRLTEMVTDDNESLHFEAIQSLNKIFDVPFNEMLRDCLLGRFHGPDHRVRHTASRLLCKMAYGESLALIEARFSELTRDLKPGIRVAAAGGLAQLYHVSRTPELLNQLIALSYDSVAQVRSGVARLLGEIGSVVENERLLNRLFELSADSSGDVRAATIWALGHLFRTPRADDVVERLLELATLDKFDAVHGNAIIAIASISAPMSEAIQAKLASFWEERNLATDYIARTAWDPYDGGREQLGEIACRQLRRLAEQREKILQRSVPQWT